jgi:ATP-dependent Lon protease
MPKKNQNNKTMPYIPLRGLMVFPRMSLHFDVGRPGSVQALEKAMVEDQRVLLLTQKDENDDHPTLEKLYPI